MSISPDALRQLIADDEFGLLNLPAKPKLPTREDRLVASFREIVDFVSANGREPQVETGSVMERQLAMRLRAILGNEEQRTALSAYDELGLLKEPEPPASIDEVFADDDLDLLDEGADDIFDLKNVPSKPKAATVPEKIAQRRKCEDFELFEPLFKQCHADLHVGIRKIVKFRKEQHIRPDTYYVLKGMLVYVAESEAKRKEHGRINARLRCIFENGTEADLLLRSLSSQLYRFGKRITDPDAKVAEEMGLAPNTRMASVYVLRSLSTDPQVTGLENVYKIGSTKRTIEERTKDAFKRTTFLGAPVELVAEYQVPAGIEAKVEKMLHRLFGKVCLDVWFHKDGRTVATAREWFVVPLPVIDEAIQLIPSGAITNYEYDPDSQRLVLLGHSQAD